MFAIHVPTRMRAVALPMSCAVARASLFTSVVKMASKPASSAALATSRMSLARQPAPGMTVTPNRSALIPVPLHQRKGRNPIAISRASPSLKPTADPTHITVRSVSRHQRQPAVRGRPGGQMAQ